MGRRWIWGRAWSGRPSTARTWHVPLVGGHTLVVGSTGAGKNSVMWCPLVSIAPAIRDGLAVRVSGIDPKGMELAYGRRIFTRYAVTGTDALTLLDELVHCDGRPENGIRWPGASGADQRRASSGAGGV